MWPLAFVLALLTGAEPVSPVAIAPAMATGAEVHLEVDEDLDVEALRAVARPGIVLWMHTRSNMLRDSTRDALRGGRVWIQMRAEILPVHVRQLPSVRAGIWVQAEDFRRVRGVGPHPIAIDLREPATRVQLKPGQPTPHTIVWRPTSAAAVSAAALGWLALLPGRHFVRLSAAAIDQAQLSSVAQLSCTFLREGSSLADLGLMATRFGARVVPLISVGVDSARAFAAARCVATPEQCSAQTDARGGTP